MKNMRQRLNLEHVMHTRESADKVFPLLCPVREYEWIPHWSCEILYTSSGYAELGFAFTTDFKDMFGRETWVVCIYEPNERIGFVRTGEKRTTRYTITLEEDEIGVALLWQQEMTSLDPAADELVAEHGPHLFGKQMVLVEKLLNHYLNHGTIYSGD
ncbi:MAG: hypothetical protein QNJ17_09555 [Desulfocapsaceae bacterium]|nr:hypothetical protein [Desulfocapsaceae bacterium]